MKAGGSCHTHLGCVTHPACVLLLLMCSCFSHFADYPNYLHVVFHLVDTPES